MMRILFVGDGPRDKAVVPRLTERVLSVVIADQFRDWKSLRLHKSGTGGRYVRKLRYAVRVARDGNVSGIVAVVDADRAKRRERLKQLQDGRKLDRASLLQFPTAVGEAVPHVDAWLLDDPQAIRRALGLPANVSIPTVRTSKSPKRDLNELIDQSSQLGNSVSDVLAAIARLFDPTRCHHQSETGFKSFVADVSGEIGPVVKG